MPIVAARIRYTFLRRNALCFYKTYIVFADDFLN